MVEQGFSCFLGSQHPSCSGIVSPEEIPGGSVYQVFRRKLNQHFCPNNLAAVGKNNPHRLIEEEYFYFSLKYPHLLILEMCVPVGLCTASETSELDWTLLPYFPFHLNFGTDPAFYQSDHPKARVTKI